MFVSVPRLFEP